jgi:hypothetical protein
MVMSNRDTPVAGYMPASSSYERTQTRITWAKWVIAAAAFVAICVPFALMSLPLAVGMSLGLATTSLPAAIAIVVVWRAIKESKSSDPALGRRSDWPVLVAGFACFVFTLVVITLVYPGMRLGLEEAKEISKVRPVLPP